MLLTSTSSTKVSSFNRHISEVKEQPHSSWQSTRVHHPAPWLTTKESKQLAKTRRINTSSTMRLNAKLKDSLDSATEVASIWPRMLRFLKQMLQQRPKLYTTRTWLHSLGSVPPLWQVQIARGTSSLGFKPRVPLKPSKSCSNSRQKSHSSKLCSIGKRKKIWIKQD